MVADLNSIEQIIIDLVAECRGDTAANVLADLESDGASLPISSLEMIEILVKLEKEVGVRIPPDEVDEDDLRSVRALATHVAALQSGSATGQVGA